ncbi:uncharacterized protein LOC113847389 [Abrus precatorius]|uniref:Uncharacterized protein LOC113847389 n=1 Tax=Abrus precatorius TaxID=3816 RepID=A0A8B8JLC8_ABRPR|nr:uncharacterized protein LOC113847389 [Abrus precatorius]
MCTTPYHIFIPPNSSHTSLLFRLSFHFTLYYSSLTAIRTMPFALETNGGVPIRRSTFAHCVSICDRDFPADDSDSSGSSSIGRNSTSSEDSSDREDSGEVEVQSSFKGPLDTINDLEEDLPVKKGISKFYSGKSKSFTSLADAAAATCMEDIVKPEDPYAKKRKNLLARNILIERSHSCSDNVGGISKRPANISRGASCLVLSSSGSSEEGRNSTSISPPCPLPPLHPHPTRSSNRSSANASLPQPSTTPWRSYSWSDLQSVAGEAHDLSGLAICSGNKGNKVH